MTIEKIIMTSIIVVSITFNFALTYNAIQNAKEINKLKNRIVSNKEQLSTKNRELLSIQGDLNQCINNNLVLQTLIDDIVSNLNNILIDYNNLIKDRETQKRIAE